MSQTNSFIIEREKRKRKRKCFLKTKMKAPFTCYYINIIWSSDYLCYSMHKLGIAESQDKKRNVTHLPSIPIYWGIRFFSVDVGRVNDQKDRKLKHWMEFWIGRGKSLSGWWVFSFFPQFLQLPFFLWELSASHVFLYTWRKFWWCPLSSFTRGWSDCRVIWMVSEVSY